MGQVPLNAASAGHAKLPRAYDDLSRVGYAVYASRKFRLGGAIQERVQPRRFSYRGYEWVSSQYTDEMKETANHIVAQDFIRKF